jgi:hypothetical protein
MTSTASNNAIVMRQKLDSIKNELDIVRKSSAIQSDQSLGLLLQQDKVNLKALSVKEQMLNVMYAEAIKNYESFEFMYKATIPSLMLIDAPFGPLKPTQKSKFIFTIIISMLLSVSFIVVVRIILLFNSIFKYIIPTGLLSYFNTNLFIF